MNLIQNYFFLLVFFVVYAILVHMDKRISWIDIARGLGIILVIYAHGLTGESYRYIIYAFHMPLFFFLSGVTFHVKNYEGYFLFIKKSIKHILWPYFMFAALGFLIWIVNQKTLTSEAFFHQLYGIFYGNGNKNLLIFNNVLWFLPCLFVVKSLFDLITKVTTKKTIITLILSLFSIAGFIFSKEFPREKLFFGIETALTAIVFFGMGYIWNSEKKLSEFFQKRKVVLTALFFLVLVVFAVINYELYGKQVDLRVNRLNNYFLTYIAAFAGIFGTITLSMWINKNKVLEYLGNKSLILFVWHLIIFSYITRFLRQFISIETITENRDTYFAIIYTIVSVIIILTLDVVVKKTRIMIKKHTLI